MNADCDDQAIQAVFGPEEFGGIDNEGLDFSQLEKFLNNDQDAANLYFPEGLVVASPSKPNTYPGLCVQSDSSSSSNHLVVSSSEYGDSPCFSNNHNLPDSPPDSSSEPPYSPDNENKMNNSISNHNPEVVHIAQSVPQDAANNPEKHYGTYENFNNTIPLKHLPEVAVLPIPNNLPMPVASSQHGPLQVINSPIQQLGSNVGSNITHLNGGNVLTQPSYIESCQPRHNSPNANLPQTIYTIPTDQSIYNNPKKRKLSESPKNIVNTHSSNNSRIQVKNEPGLSPESASMSNRSGNEDDHFGFDHGEQSMFMDSPHHCIRFQDFQATNWHTTCNRNLKELPPPEFRVNADKGFNFSHCDNSFVCQKKNHFQITVHLKTSVPDVPHYIKTPEGLKPIDNYHIHFYGVKAESQNQVIRVEQSQSDRSKKAFHPVPIDLLCDQVSKVTVGRMHFSETTSNNMRKKGKPNPDQRYFNLVVSLNAHCGDSSYIVVAKASDRIIVRASNPGQFENDADVSWQKGQTAESVYHCGRVGVNTDQPDEALVVHGNVKITGHLVQPSDRRAKENIEEIDSKIQLQNVSQMRIVKYQYEPQFATHAGLSEDDTNDTGVIAQEVKDVLPDAVREAGDIVLPNGQVIDNFLVVNKERIFMENVGAVKELCKVTDNLENRIDELERMNQKLRLKRIDSQKSTSSASTVTSCSSAKVKRKRLRHSNHKNDKSCCPNKTVQITIFVLVLVMACCLISMTTLYFYERRPTHNYQSPNSSILSDDKSRKSTYSPIIYSTKSDLDPGQKGKVETTSQKSILAKLLPPPVIGKPNKCVGLTVDPKACPVYCCSVDVNSFQYEINNPKNQDIVFKDRKQLQPIDRAHVASRAMNFNSVNPPTSTKSSINSHHALFDEKSVSDDEVHENNVPLLDVGKARISSGYATPGSTKHWTDADFNSQNNQNRVILNNHKRLKRSVDFANKHGNIQKNVNLPLDSNILFYIPEFNFTVSPDYCVNDGCIDGTGGQKIYKFPLSKYMSQSSVHLVARFAPGMVFDTCSLQNGPSCPFGSIKQMRMKVVPRVAHSRHTSEASIELPLIYNINVTLTARLTRKAHYSFANESCNAPESEMGKKFIDYKFHFYKVCNRD